MSTPTTSLDDQNAEEPDGIAVYAWTERGRIRSGVRVRQVGGQGGFDGRFEGCFTPRLFRRVRRRLYHQGLVPRNAPPGQCFLASIREALKGYAADEGRAA